MPSVLHICTDFWPNTGGIESFVLNLAKHSMANGLQASVLCFNRVSNMAKKLPANEEVEGIPVTRVPYLDLKFYKPSWLPLSLMRQHDLIHVHGIGAPLDYTVMTKILHRRPILVSTHGGIFHTDTLLWLKKIYFFGMVKLTLKAVNMTIACSKSDKRLFSSVTKHMTLIENAVDIGAHLKLPLNQKIRGRCLYVGRLSENKGIPALLNAFSIAKQLGSSFELRLVGPDRESKSGEYKQLARMLDIEEEVQFIGEVSSEALLLEYQQAENFVSASEYEGFGLSALEAKAAGCRLLLQANEAFTSLFNTDERVQLFDFSHSQSAGQIIHEILSKAPASDEMAERQLTESYSWEHKIHDWLALYKRYEQQPPLITRLHSD